MTTKTKPEPKEKKELIWTSQEKENHKSEYGCEIVIENGTLDINREYLPNKSSITEVKIENFYLKEMPVLTKISNIYNLWKLNKIYNKLSFIQNLSSLLYISLNSLKKYGLK